MILRALAISLALAGAAEAQSLQFPSNAALMREEATPLDSYVVPTGIWENGALPTLTAEGQIARQAWRIAAPSLTTLQILRPLREQLRNDRFRILFECQTEACGGFDFRFAIDTFPPPEMRINIGDFRYLAAERQADEGMEYLTLRHDSFSQSITLLYPSPMAFVLIPSNAIVATIIMNSVRVSLKVCVL